MTQLTWLPNVLSSLRIVMALFFPFISQQQHQLILLLALLSEYLDGALARKFNCTTPSGQLLDPIADKLFALSVGITFITLGKMSVEQLLFISIRDIFTAIGFLLNLIYFKKHLTLNKFRPHIIGKITTAFQYLVFFDLALVTAPHSGLILVTGLLSLVAAIIYGRNFYLSFR